jgi:hypothetical protein
VPVTANGLVDGRAKLLCYNHAPFSQKTKQSSVVFNLYYFPSRDSGGAAPWRRAQSKNQEEK